VQRNFGTAATGKFLPLLALLLSLTLPSPVQAQFEYAIENGAVTITEYTGHGGAVTIPATDQFGFNITASSELTVVVEASASLTDPTLAPLGTNTLAGDSSYFSDPQWIKSSRALLSPPLTVNAASLPVANDRQCF